MNEIPIYMTVFTIYILCLPFLLLLSINYVKKNQIKKHIISQSILLSVTLLFIVYFEVMVRLDGGVFKYASESSLPFYFIIIFLILHIFIAIISIAAWIFLFIKSYKEYKKGNFFEFNREFDHKRVGKLVFMAMTISSFLGVFIYMFLFII